VKGEVVWLGAGTEVAGARAERCDGAGEDAEDAVEVLKERGEGGAS
jgi:hypothetical protein